METQQSVSFYKVAQLKMDEYLQRVNLTSGDVIRYVSVFGIGFLLGIVFKRYGTIIISWLIGVLLIGLIFNYFDLIIVQKANIKILLNLEHVHSLDDLMIELKVQMNRYGIESILCGIAIILGFKLG